MAIDKIICVGKNYLEHAKELGDAIPKAPVLFLKPASVLKQAQKWQDTVEALLPSPNEDVHYECEIVMRVKHGGYQMTREQAAQAIDAVTLGLDMTLRTKQAELKKNGHPWTTAKVFIDSAIIGPWIAIKDFPNYMHSEFTLSLDGQVRQHASGTEMTMNPVDLLMYISQSFPICEGDLIFTGTPAGVGQVHPGSRARLAWGNCYYDVVWA